MKELSRLYDTLSSTHWSFKYLDPSGCPQSLLQALLKELPHIEHASWDERLAWGGVFVNGRAAKADGPLAAPCLVEYFEPKFPISAARHYFPDFMPEYVVYEDEDLLVAFKPPGLPCLPNREQSKFNLKTYLNRHIQKTSGGVEIHLPSRLDAAVGGLIAASKSRRMHRELQQLYEKRLVSKTYLLEVPGAFSHVGELTVEKPIGRDERHPILRKVDEQGGQRALTRFSRLMENIFSGEVKSLLRAQPLTGRTHQIRVHAGSIGYPIVGDAFYGGAPAPELRLLSTAFKFFNPFRNDELEIQLPQALEPLWLKEWRKVP